MEIDPAIWQQITFWALVVLGAFTAVVRVLEAIVPRLEEQAARTPETGDDERAAWLRRQLGWMSVTLDTVQMLLPRISLGRPAHQGTSTWDHLRMRRERREIEEGSRRPPPPPPPPDAGGIIMLMIVAVLAWSSQGCTPASIRGQAKAALATERVVNSLSSEARREFEQTERRAIEAACGQGALERPAAEAACSRDQYAAAVAPVRQQWAPVWEAHDGLRFAHRAWVRALTTMHAAGGFDAGLAIPLAENLVRAYRSFAAALQAVGLRMPPVPPILSALVQEEDDNE